MASPIYTRGAVQFIDETGRRQTIYLGTKNKRDIDGFVGRVDQLLSAKVLGNAPARELAEWIASLPEELREKLAKVGLLGPVQRIPALGQWLDDYIAQRKDLAPGSITLMKETAELLKAKLGADTRIDRITANHAQEWQATLQQPSDATRRRHARYAKLLFNAAVDRELIERNPFRKLLSASLASKHDRYITPEETQAIIDACPNVQWKALVGLMRFASLRHPSETDLLTWSQVDWEANRLKNVFSPKNGTKRDIPIDHRLMPLLLAAFHESETGNDKVITLRCHNRRRSFEMILKRAKIEPWSKLFHNLRAGAATDWRNLAGPDAAALWSDHSATVAAKHYAQVPNRLYDLASQNPAKAQQSAQQRDVAEACEGLKGQQVQNAEAKVPQEAAINSNDVNPELAGISNP